MSVLKKEYSVSLAGFIGILAVGQILNHYCKFVFFKNVSVDSCQEGCFINKSGANSGHTESSFYLF